MTKPKENSKWSPERLEKFRASMAERAKHKAEGKITLAPKKFLKNAKKGKPTSPRKTKSKVPVVGSLENVGDDMQRMSFPMHAIPDRPRKYLKRGGTTTAKTGQVSNERLALARDIASLFDRILKV